MHKINIDASENSYFYYEDPFSDFVGENNIFKESEDGGLILSSVSQELSESQRKIIDTISEFYKCLHKKHETVNYEDLCFINKELFEKFKPLQTFVFRENNWSQNGLSIKNGEDINPIENKINYWTDFRKEWYYWVSLIFIFGELRLYFLRKQLPDHQDNNKLDGVLNNFFHTLKPLRCFYNTMDMLAPKDFRGENISVNDLLLQYKNIFKFKIITPQKNGIIEKGTVNSVCQTKFDGKNYRYKKMNVFEKVPRISADDKENNKKLTNRQKQNLIMGNYFGAKENDLVIVDPIFRQLAMPIISEHFGFENIIPTEIGFLDEGNDLEPVCLMEEAKGKIGHKIFLYNGKELTTRRIDFEKNDKTAYISFIEKNMAKALANWYDVELIDASNPHLQIEALKLAIVDCIGLILDRTSENLFFDNTQNVSFKFIGIDNDWVGSLTPNQWYEDDLLEFFKAKVPFITSNLKKEVLGKLSDTNGIKKLLARLEGKINRGPGGEKVMQALEERINSFKYYIDKECKVIDELNSKTAKTFIESHWNHTKNNPISALNHWTHHRCHPEKISKKLPGIEEKIMNARRDSKVLVPEEIVEPKMDMTGNNSYINIK